MDEKVKHGAAPPGETHELAGVSARLIAGVIDAFLSVALLVLVSIVLDLIVSDSGSILQTVGLAVPIAYQWYFLTRRDGQTPGKFGLGIRVIKADGTRISDTDAVIRAIGYNVSSIFCGLGYIWAILTKTTRPGTTSWREPTLFARTSSGIRLTCSAAAGCAIHNPIAQRNIT